MNKAGGKIADIEVLRAFAVSFVVLHHANGNLLKRGELFGGFIQQYFGGWVGVDLFFAISGFVIARNLLPRLAIADNAAAYRRLTYRFWGKRALRLLPSAWAWLAIVLLLQVCFNDSGIFGTLRANIWATVAAVFHFANFRFADAFMNYEYGASFVYWSLSLEEQFYFLLPVVFFISRKYFVPLMLLLVVIQILQQRSLFGMAIRSDAICLGVLIAIFTGTEFYARLNPRNNRVLFLCFRVLSISGLCLLPFLAPLTRSLSCQIGLIASLSAAIVFFCTYDLGLLARLPLGKFFVWLGGRSYAVYLIHIPVFFTVRELAYRYDIVLEEQPYLVLIAAVAIILVLAQANYRYIETPVARYSRQLFDRRD